MRPTLATVVLVGLLVLIAKADDKPTPSPSEASKVRLEKDVRLAKLRNAPLQTIGILTYYPNNGGGYTFLEHEHIVFYSLPYASTTYKAEYVEDVALRRVLQVHTKVVLGTIGTGRMPMVVKHCTAVR